AHAVHWLAMRQVELHLSRADRCIAPLEHGEVQPLLAAEIVVEHALVDAGSLGDAVDPRPVIAALRELGHGRGEDRRTGSLGVALALAPNFGEGPGRRL